MERGEWSLDGCEVVLWVYGMLVLCFRRKWAYGMVDGEWGAGVSSSDLAIWEIKGPQVVKYDRKQVQKARIIAICTRNAPPVARYEREEVHKARGMNAKTYARREGKECGPRRLPYA